MKTKKSVSLVGAPVIVNKYHLGQRLWPIVTWAGKARVNPPFDNLYMSVLPTGSEVFYSYTSSYGFAQCNVFASKADAEAECKHRNRRPPSAGRTGREG